ncbi:MAG: zinc-ribbon domain-containing protein [Candidatus Methanomethylophilaceae archaeon]
MSEDGFTGFCSKCGAKIHESADFCPECGNPVHGGVAAASTFGGPAVGGPDMTDKKAADSRLMWVTVLTAIFAIFAIIGGIYSVVGIDSMIQMFKDALGTDGWTQFLSDMGMTETQFHDYVVNSGYVSITSGAIVAITLILVVIRKNWMIAVATCALGSVSCFFALAVVPSEMVSSTAFSAALQFVIGMIVTYMIYKSKVAFTS